MAQDIKLAKMRTMMYYVQKLLVSHFQMISPNKIYTPNKLSYQLWKAKHVGVLWQLVVTGRLRNAMLGGTVKQDGSVFFDIPEYGLYQIKAGRDFVSPTKRDKIAMERRFKQELKSIRSAKV